MLLIKFNELRHLLRHLDSDFHDVRILLDRHFYCLRVHEGIRTVWF